MSKHGSLRLVLGAIAGLALVVPAAASADTTYPGGGAQPSQFSAGSEGWTDTNHECALVLDLLQNAVCTITNGVDATTGNPAGSLETTYETAVNLLGLATGTSTFTSPSF